MIPAFLSNAASWTFLNTISQVSIEALRETGEVVEKEEKKKRLGECVGERRPEI